MASSYAEGTNADEDFVVCDMCEAGKVATSHCDDCLMNLCDYCVVDFHRKLVRRGRHCVTEGVVNFKSEIELCSTHAAKLNFFCTNCSVRVCPECEIGLKGHTDHTVTSLDVHVAQEKEKLLERLDGVTNKTETISYFPDHIKAAALKIELKWMERKEQIRQEFTSLYELITTRQQEVFSAMENEVNKALQELNTLKEDQENIMFDSCQLSDECISAVQHLPQEDFMQSYPQFMDRFQKLEGRVSRMSSPDDFVPSFLAVPFSLYKEKCHLDRCLQFPVFNCLNLKPKEYNKFIPYEQLRNQVAVKNLVHAPLVNDLPPSSVLRYQVEIRASIDGTQDSVWSSKEPLKATDVVLNGSVQMPGVTMREGWRYKVNVMPHLMSTTHNGKVSTHGRSITILIVAGYDLTFRSLQARVPQIATPQGPRFVFKQPATTQGASFVFKQPAATQGPRFVFTATTQGPGFVFKQPATTQGPSFVFSNSSKKIKIGTQNKDMNNNNNIRVSFVHPDFPANQTHTLQPVTNIKDIYNPQVYGSSVFWNDNSGKETVYFTDELEESCHLKCKLYLIDVSFEEARLLQDKSLRLFKVQSLSTT